MNTVLYTADFEPITIIDLPLHLLEQLERDGGARVAVQKPLTLKDLEGTQPLESRPDILTLYCNKLRWSDGTLKTIVCTPNDELALSLRPEWLPGQVQAVNWYRDNLREAVDIIFKNRKKS
jgi:hypothetical protein